MNIIKKMPIPFCGVMLGCAALGNLLQSYSEGVRLCFGAVAAVIMVLMLAKLICFPKMIAEDMTNPIMASVAATFPMTLMLLSTYAKPFIGGAAYYIWLLAIGLHIALIVYFTMKFMVKLQLPKVFASYFIVYVGIAVAAITAPAYEKLAIGAAAFWFGLVSLAVLLVIVTIRYIKVKEVPAPAKPLICIYAAPASLCLAGYIQSVTPKSQAMIFGLLALATVLYVFGLLQCVKYITKPFVPAFASFTFPFVISGIAAKQSMACLAKLGNPQPWLQPVVLVETVIATVLVVYTLIRFVMFVTAKPAQK